MALVGRGLGRALGQKSRLMGKRWTEDMHGVRMCEARLLALRSFCVTRRLRYTVETVRCMCVGM